MTTYDNLNIAQTTLIFDSNGNTSVASGTFDLSSLAFLPNIPLIDQIEVERIFDTGFDTKFGAYSFTIADRRQMFIFPKDWYTINEQTKVLTFKDLSTIPVQTENDLYYPYSRTFTLQASVFPDLDIPVVQATSSSINGITRQYDKVYIRRKTPSINSIVTFAPGTRLTTTQLNLQFDQLKYNIQELVAKFRNEAILKYDENAVDGPFLGQGDLKMNNNYIKDVNSPAFTQAGTTITDASGLNFNADTFLVNLGTVVDGIVNGTLHRTGVNTSSSTFTGDFTATGLKLTNLADGSVASDAATIGQTTNATNLVTGTLAAERLANASIPLEKLSATRVTYTLPSSALENILTSATAYGSSTDSNNNNMVYLTTDVKGRISSIGHRSMSYADLPTTTVTGTTYGSGKLLTLAINNKGIITGVSDTAISIANLPVSGVTAGTYGSASGTAAGALPRLVINDKGIVTEATSRVIEVNDLPTTSVTGAGTKGQATATNANNMLQITYDTAGRVTSASHRTMGTGDLPSDIPLSKLSGTNDGFTLPTSAIGNTSIVLGKIDFAAGGTIPSGNLPPIDLGNINASNRGTFVLPEDAVPLVPTVNTAASTWNTYPVKDFKVDAKGRIFNVSERAFTDGDIGAISASKITSGVLDDGRIPAPSPAPTANTYGSASGIPVITVDAKGRITNINTTTHAVANISDYTTATDTRIDNRALSRGTGSTYDAGSRKIINVLDPTTAQDVVTKNYLELNALVVSGGVISAASTPITNMTMRATGSIAADDAVNYGFIENLVLAPGTTLIGSTTPQIYRDAWSSLSKTPGHLTGFDRYQRTFTDLGAVASTMVLLEADAVTKTFIPYSVAAIGGGSPTVHDGYFWLDTSGANKVLNIWLTTGTTPTGNLVTRNFGLSRLVSGALATTTSTGLVSILNNGGITVNAGEISLTTATSSQLGGIKIGTGLGIASGVVSVNLTDSTATTSSTTAASATAVKAAYDYTTSQIGSTNSTVNSFAGIAIAAQSTANAALPKAGGTLTGPLALATGTNIPLKFTAATPTSPTDGSVWYESNVLRMQIASGPKTIAFTDSTLTGSAASAAKWTTGMNLALGGDLSGNITFDGSAGVTLNATIANNSVALGTDTTGNYVATVAAGDGITVSGSGSETAAVTVTNSDRGSLQNIYKRVVAGGITISADSNDSAITITGSSGITVTGNNTTKSFDIASSLTLPNSFSTITVSGQPNVVADGTADTLNLAVGSGITITTNATTDTLTLNNTGVLSIAGSSNQITASAATGAVSLTLPQSIGTSSDVQFNSATLGSITVGSTTIGSSAGLTLAPTSAATAVTGSLTVSTTLGVTGTSAFTGAVTLNNSLALSAAASTIAFGGTAAAATTSINRAGSATGVNQIGDIILRTPANGKAYLVANATNTTVTTANDAIVTKGVMDTAISGLGSTYMSTAGALATTNQTLGAGSGSFIVQTGTPTPASRLTIVNSGAATFSGALAVTGATTLSNTLVVSGATTLNSTLVVSGLVTASAVPTDGNHLANKTYVDAQDLTAPFAYERTLAKLQRDRTVDSLGVISMVNGITNVIDLSTIAIGVPTVVKYNYNGNSGNITCTLNLAVEGTESAYLLFKGISGSGVITTATVLSDEVVSNPTVDLTTATAPPAVVPNTPTLLSGAGNIQLYTRTASSVGTRVGFTILRIS